MPISNVRYNYPPRRAEAHKRRLPPPTPLFWKMAAVETGLAILALVATKLLGLW